MHLYRRQADGSWKSLQSHLERETCVCRRRGSKVNGEPQLRGEGPFSARQSKHDDAIRLRAGVRGKRQRNTRAVLGHRDTLTRHEHLRSHDASADVGQREHAIGPLQHVDVHRVPAPVVAPQSRGATGPGPRCIYGRAVRRQPLPDFPQTLNCLGLNRAVRPRPDVQQQVRAVPGRADEISDQLPRGLELPVGDVESPRRRSS